MAELSDKTKPPRGILLLADDELAPRRATARVLRHLGYEVDTAEDGEAAARAIKARSYDVILSDIAMPGMDGIELLRHIHERDADVPVILITGAPAVETAVEALEHGAYKYLLKPVASDRLDEVVQKAVNLRKMALLRREAANLMSAEPEGDLRDSFDSAMSSLWMAYQPIVNRDGILYGHEALLRSNEPRLPHPGAVLDAAEKLGELNTLGRLVRERASASVADKPAARSLFVNLHPRDLEDEQLVDPDSGLAKIARRVVLEITERASVESVADLRKTIGLLRKAGYRIAIDDLGAGYAGLSCFALLEPEIVKIDMSLVRDVDQSPVKQRLILSITSLCREMGIEVVGEGVETASERDKLLDLGIDLFQGYYIAKPDKPFPEYRW